MKTIFTKDFAFLVLSTMLIACASFDVMPCIAVYAKLFTHSGMYVGLATAAFFIGSVWARIIGGELVRIFGTRKLMQMGAGLCIVVCIAHSFAVSIALLIFLRILHGIGYSVFSTASGTATSYFVPKERISEGMGYYMLSSVLAMAIGPSLALAIISRGTASQFHLLFYVSAAICAVALVFVYLLKSNSRSAFKKRCSASDIATRNLPRAILGFEKGVVLPVVLSFLMSFAYSPVLVYLSMYGLSKGWGHIGAAFTMYAVGLCASRLFTGRISDRFGSDFVMVPAYLCGVVSLIVIALGPAEWLLFPAMMILGLCIGGYNPEIIVFCISRCSLPRRGSALAAFNGSADLGLAAGSAIGGILVDFIGFPSTMLWGAFLCVLTLVLYLLTLSKLANAKRMRA